MANISMNHSKWYPPCPYPPDIPRTFYGNDFIMTFIVINAVFALISSCNNFVVIYTIVRTPSIQVLPSNILVMGLAISDFGVAVFVQPAYCIFKFFELKRSLSLFCKYNSVFGFSIWILGTVSLLTLTAITADRFLAVHLHLRYQELVTTRRYGILLGCIWVSCTAVSICRMYLEHLSFIRLLALLLFALIMTLNLYFLVKIFQVIRRHSVQIQAQQQSVQQSIDMPRYKKSVNTMYYMMGAFLLCYIPYAGTLVAISDASKKITQQKLLLLVVAETLVMFNGVLNPIIYCWRIQDIREAALKLFCKRSSTQEMPYPM